ncbi:MAG: hypothetical protein MAG458_01421 [Nitrosopumilus sp.]|nr:hypothetical protein [Nitrosopumilus sp.]
MGEVADTKTSIGIPKDDALKIGMICSSRNIP